MDDIDEEEEERVLTDLMRDFIEFEIGDGADHYDEFCAPVTFGAAAATSSDPTTETKPEPEDTKPLSNGHAVHSPPPPDASLSTSTLHAPPPGSVADLFLRCDKSEMFLIQLPTALPSIISKDTQFSAKNQAGPSSSVEEMDDSDNRSDCCQLQDLPDGQIGTMKRYRSGKMTFCFGDYEMPIEFDDVPDYVQEVVHSKVDKDTRQGRLSVLGKIGSKMLVMPDFKKLLEQRNKATISKR